MTVAVNIGTGSRADFECHEGSHVYVKNAEGKECFRDWSELTPEETLKYLAVRDSLKEAISSSLKGLI